jgi:serine/threonine protein kinase
MTSTDRWLRIEDIYHQALERDGGDRSSFVAAMCGDDVHLRDEVLSLLERATRAETFLERRSGVALVGQTIGHYLIVEEIGAGGMGVVYRARDAHLERDVALKMLPPGTLVDESARRRFRREALTLSKINHPNIATIHDFDTHGDVDFLVMEHISGTTLVQKLAAGSLPEAEVVRLAVQLADGLAAAHAYAIVHRDLKPANLRLTNDGWLKILDFGLATLRVSANADAAAAHLVETHPMAGTLAYMAPEQLTGGATDARTDIHAAGFVLYEMVTGRRAFAGLPRTQLVAALLGQTPEAPKALSPAPSTELQQIIGRCLEKAPERRYQSATELAADLRRLQTDLLVGVRAQPSRRAAERRIESLAVLPLENLSGDAAQEYFADGMTDSLITNLGWLTGLKAVIARGSVMRYKGTTARPAEIARELNVDALITGAVVRSGDRVRVTAQLIDPTSGQQLWAERYERALTDVLRLQNDVTKAIAAEIRLKLTRREQDRLSSGRSVNPDAYDASIMGLFHWSKGTPQALDRAAEHFQLALDVDPHYAPAHAGIGWVWGLRAHAGLVLPRSALPRVKAAALRAIELEPAQPQGHDLLASILTWYEWDWAAGEAEYRRAIECSGNFANARTFYSFFLHAMGRREEAKAQMERALDLDPHNAFLQRGLAMELLDEHRTDEALVHLQRAETLQPDSLFVHASLWSAFHLTGEYEKARAEAKEYFELLGLHDVVEALGRGHDPDDYRAALGRAAAALAERSSRASVSPYDVARLYALVGDEEDALDWIEKACDVRSSKMPYVNVNWEFESLRARPRFRQVLRRMSFPPESP